MQTTKAPLGKKGNEKKNEISRMDKHFNFENLYDENENIYKTIFHNTPLGIIHFDKSGKVIDCNNKFSEIIGVKREGLLTINLIKDLNEYDE